MLSLVRGNSPYTVLILAIFTLFLKLQALANPLLPAADVHHALYGGIIWLLSTVLGKSATAYCMCAVLMCFLQGLYLKAIAARHRLFSRNSYLPAFLYIAFTSLYPALGQFSLPLLMNWLLLGAFDALLRFSRREGVNRVVFNSGFLLGCLGLLHFPALALGLLLPLSLLWLRSFRPGEWIVALLGYCTPFYFALGLLYLFGNMDWLRTWPFWAQIQWSVIKPGAGIIGLAVGLLFLLGVGLTALLRTSFQMTVSVRRAWYLSSFLLVLALGVCAWSHALAPAIWLCTLPSLALFVAPPLLAESRPGKRRSGRFATFTFYLILALVVFCQLALPT